MTEIKKRKIHTPEFKAKVGLEALRSGKTINQISQEFGVHPIQVGQWKKANKNPRPKGRGIQNNPSCGSECNC